MHHHAFRFVQRVAEQLAASASPVTRVLEIGSRNINGSVRPLFPAVAYLGVDVVDGPGVDVVADGATVSPPEAPDCVLCCEVLEHTDQAEAIIAHALELLPAGGHLIVTCAAPDRAPHSAVDGGPLRPDEYYANLDPVTLAAWVTTHGGAVSTLDHYPGRGDVYLWARKRHA